MNEYGKRVGKKMEEYMGNPDSIEQEVHDLKEATEGVQVRGALAASVSKSFTKSKWAEEKAIEQTERVDTLIRENPQPSEVVDARGGYPILRDRLNSLDSQLAQKADNARVSNLIVNAIEKSPDNFSSVFNFTTTTGSIRSNGATTDADNTFNGNPTVKLTATSALNADFRVDLGRAIDFTESEYIGLFIKVENIEDINALQITLATDSAFQNNYTRHQIKDLIGAPDASGWSLVRIPRSTISIVRGTPDWKNMRYLMITVTSGTSATINIASLLNWFPAAVNPEILDSRIDLEGNVHKLLSDRINADLNYVLENAGSLNVKSLPVDREKYDGTRTPFFDFETVNGAIRATNASTDTLNTFMGSPTIKLTSPNGARADLRMDMGTSFNFADDDYFVLYLKGDIKDISSIQFHFGTSDPVIDSYYVYNLMPFISPLSDNGWYRIRFNKEDLNLINGEPDWSSIRYLRITMTGKSGESVECNIAQLASGKNVEAHVYMYFDDGVEAQYNDAFRIMDKYGLKGTIAVITDRVDTPGYVTTQQLREMHQAGWLITSHTHTHKDLRLITDEERHEEFKNTTKFLRDKGFHFGSRCLVAPYGSYNFLVDNIAKQYFSLVRTNGFENRLTPRSNLVVNARDQMFLSPYNTDSSDLVISWIDNLIEKKGSLAIAWHDFGDPTATYIYDTAEFDVVCAYVRDKIDEGVIKAVTWQDTMLQTLNPQPFDMEGKKYNTTYKGKEAIVTLPI